MNDPRPNRAGAPSAFLPTLMIGLSLLAMLSWQVFLGVRQYRSGLEVVDRQVVLTAQAAQAEEFLQTLMMDLIELAKTDVAARDIVQRYNISFTPPAAAPQPPVALPAAAVAPPP